MKRVRRWHLWLILILMLPVIGILSSCGDETQGEEGKPGGQSRSMRGIQAVSKTASAAQQRRLAVVIGNSKYEKSQLKNPVNDAQAMARLLRRLDFEVDLVENGGRRAMVTMINSFGRKLRQADVGLFYYAGHGIQVKGRNYLIPVDAVLETEADVEFEALDLGRVLGKMDDSHCQLNIVVLDACRDNPFVRSFRSTSKGLALVDAPRGTLLAFATAPGSVAADGEGSNGIYTKHLLTNIERSDLSIEEVFKQVRIGVVNDTDGRQTPWESSSLMGSFHFQPGVEMRKQVSAPPPAPVIAPVAASAIVPAPAETTKASESTPVQSSPKTVKKELSKSIEVAHVAKKTAPAVKKPVHSPEIKKYIKMLQSSSTKDQRYAAKKIIRSYSSNRVLLDVVNRELLKGYQQKSKDRHHVDVMAWFCKVLGASKQQRYAATLSKVADSDTNRKLKKYAAKSLRQLQ
ncbi:MAG: caspase family protein [Pseudomonadota bacterium]|nr:caspase family protein [Pseudomonadota bacterium]